MASSQSRRERRERERKFFKEVMDLKRKSLISKQIVDRLTGEYNSNPSYLTTL